VQRAEGDETLAYDGFILACKEGRSGPKFVLNEARELIGTVNAEVVQQLPVLLAARDPEGNGIRLWAIDFSRPVHKRQADGGG